MYTFRVQLAYETCLTPVVLTVVSEGTGMSRSPKVAYNKALSMASRLFWTAERMATGPWRGYTMTVEMSKQ